MLHTYRATLRGNRLEWWDRPPATLSTDQPVTVQVTILDQPTAPSAATHPGQWMASLLEQLATFHALSDITDPVAWEREIRQE